MANRSKEYLDWLDHTEVFLTYKEWLYSYHEDEYTPQILIKKFMTDAEYVEQNKHRILLQLKESVPEEFDNIVKQLMQEDNVEVLDE